MTGALRRSPRDVLQSLAERAQDAQTDNYGTGTLIVAFEKRIAALLGKEAGLFMPSGTMAQQIAMRIWCDRAHRPVVAFHPLAHPEVDERDAYRVLHGLRSVHLGTTARAMTLRDVETLAEPAALLLLELPQRYLGGTLPAWDELTAMSDAARARGMRVHLDGARLWESQPYYERSLAEIAGLFDSVYVSFYKILGGISGAMLLGDRAFIDEATIWLRRHGGNLFALYPYVLAAEEGLDRELPRVAEYVSRAGTLAPRFAAVANIDVVPVAPPTNMMHLHMRVESGVAEERARTLAQTQGIWTFERIAPTANPAIGRWEFSVGSATDAFSDDEIVTIVEALAR